MGTEGAPDPSLPLTVEFVTDVTSLATAGKTEGGACGVTGGCVDIELLTGGKVWLTPYIGGGAVFDGDGAKVDGGGVTGRCVGETGPWVAVD